MGESAVVVGATGLVGRALVDLLVDDPEYDEVVVLTRRPPTRRAPKLRHRLVDFGAFPAQEVPRGARAAFCALGTTMRAAGSEDAFRRVDHDYVLAFARACRAASVRTFHVVSAVGADARSRVFYNRVKGEMELHLQAAGLPSVTAYRPSLLLGERDERRPLERFAAGVARVTAPLWMGPLAEYRPVPAEAVARAMVHGARAAQPGFHVVRNEDLFDA